MIPSGCTQKKEITLINRQVHTKCASIALYCVVLVLKTLESEFVWKVLTKMTCFPVYPHKKFSRTRWTDHGEQVSSVYLLCNHVPIHFKTIFIEYFPFHAFVNALVYRSFCDANSFIAMFPIQQMNHAGHY